MADGVLFHWHCLGLLLVLVLLPLAVSKSNVQVITTENFSEVQSGEWMLEFYAPWCPACKQFTDVWESFADWAVERGLKVGKVDVTVETMLSGQFMVTHLPTLVHIKDAQVRPYHKGRSLDNLQEFIEEEQWKEEEPVPWWRSPTATHMKAIGTIFWLSEKAKELQVVLEEKYELPTYAVFIIIALVTIVVGLSLGGFVVCCIEVCLRLFSKPRQRVSMPTTKPKEVQVQKQTDEKQEEVDSTKDIDEVSSSGSKEQSKKSKKKARDGGGARRRK